MISHLAGRRIDRGRQFHARIRAHIEMFGDDGGAKEPHAVVIVGDSVALYIEA